MQPSGCFNCCYNTGEHPKYEVGKEYKFHCKIIAGLHGNSVMIEENPEKPMCEHFKAHNQVA